MDAGKGEEQNSSFHGPPFLLVHQDWLFFSWQKYNHRRANGFRVIYKRRRLIFMMSTKSWDENPVLLIMTL